MNVIRQDSIRQYIDTKAPFTPNYSPISALAHVAIPLQLSQNAQFQTES
jgi:hypothetical protein